MKQDLEKTITHEDNQPIPDWMPNKSQEFSALVLMFCGLGMFAIMVILAILEVVK